MNNQRTIERIDGWRKKYPAFAWCAKQGGGWYLPAIEELRRLFAVRDVINRTLELQGGIRLDDSYWSSTEIKAFCAWYVNMSDGYTNDFNKSFYYYVRAVSAF